jgi:hypothetical protein
MEKRFKRLMTYRCFAQSVYTFNACLHSTVALVSRAEDAAAEVPFHPLPANRVLKAIKSSSKVL